MKKLAVLVVLFAALPGFALAAGNIEAGKAKSTTCAGCHGAKGIATLSLYPNLAGQKEKYLEKTLRDFRTEARPNQLMKGVATALSDQDIVNLAAYYSSLDCK